jgi:hypothetical protein
VRFFTHSIENPSSAFVGLQQLITTDANGTVYIAYRRSTGGTEVESIKVARGNGSSWTIDMVLPLPDTSGMIMSFPHNLLGGLCRHSGHEGCSREDNSAISSRAGLSAKLWLPFQLGIEARVDRPYSSRIPSGVCCRSLHVSRGFPLNTIRQWIR